MGFRVTCLDHFHDTVPNEKCLFLREIPRRRSLRLEEVEVVQPPLHEFHDWSRRQVSATIMAWLTARPISEGSYLGQRISTAVVLCLHGGAWTSPANASLSCSWPVIACGARHAH